MQPHDRLPYSPIVERKPLRFPDGVRLVVWPVMSLEVWDISRPMARLAITPPQGQPLQPDHPNWSWHEYGMRVGFWRIKRMFEELKMTPTITINSRVCEVYPQVVRASLDNGWEVNAHSYDQVAMHKVEDQRGVIFKSVEMIEKFTGKRPRGWFGPGLTQTFDTVDYLAEAGIEYFGDWVADEEPVTVRTRHRPIVALPYNFELHDIVVMSLQGHSANVLYQRAKDHFDCLYEESKERAKIMAIAVHPYLSGVPHRIGHVRRTFEEILSKPGVVTWDGTKILDWYLTQQKIG